MAFTVNDLQDLLKLVREHPEWREEVRREVLGEELLTLPELVRQNSLAIDRLTERIDGLTEQTSRNSAAIEQLTGRVEELTENIDRLVNEMRQGHIDLAELRGESLERWYRDHPAVVAKVRRFSQDPCAGNGRVGASRRRH